MDLIHNGIRNHVHLIASPTRRLMCPVGETKKNVDGVIVVLRYQAACVTVV
jgi:hypothetical protein